MSEATIETVTGVCKSITERNGWTEFEIDGGGQYPVKLSTKLQPLIELGRAAGQNLATWTYKESDGKENPNRPGTFYKNRYLEKVEAGGTVLPNYHVPEDLQNATASPSTAHKSLIAGDKDRAITRMACLKAAAELFNGWTWPTTDDPDPALEVMKAASRFEAWIYRDIDEVPFELSDHDKQIPFGKDDA